ncbi:MAG: hypothetical protein ACRDH8_10200 [Actinomycetota bacterium]
MNLENIVEKVPGLRLLSYNEKEGTGRLAIANSSAKVRLFDIAPRGPGLRDRLQELEKSLSPGEIPVVIAPSLGPSTRRLLEQSGWGWIDHHGNFHLAHRDALIHVERPLPRGAVGGAPLGRASSARWRVARALLQEPQRLYRLPDLENLAEAHVSSISRGLKGLVEDHLVERVNGGWRVIDPPSLLDAFVESRVQLSRKAVEAFYFVHPASVRELMASLVSAAEAASLEVAFTGFTAAEMIQPLVPATQVDAYVHPYSVHGNRLRQLLRLIDAPAEDANLRVRSSSDKGAFVGAKLLDEFDLPVVGHAQLIADLYAIGGRANEAAELLRKQWGL